MGWAKYYEDNVDILDDYNFMSTYSKWSNERQNYKSDMSLDEVINKRAIEESASRVKICNLILNSLEIRIALLDELYILRSPLFQQIVDKYKKDLKNAQEKVANRLTFYDSKNYVTNYDVEKNPIKQVLIYQLIENVFAFILKIEEENPDGVKILFDDIRVLVNWSKSKNKDKRILYEVCEYDMFENYLSENKFNVYAENCHICGEKYIAQNQYCSKCYSLRK